LLLLLQFPAKIQKCRGVLAYSPLVAQAKYLFSLDDFYHSPSLRAP